MTLLLALGFRHSFFGPPFPAVQGSASLPYPAIAGHQALSIRGGDNRFIP